MKQMTEQDIQALRQSILTKFDDIIDNYLTARKVLGEDKEQMLKRLKKAKGEGEELLLSSQKVHMTQASRERLFHELNELRLYFGAPTGRPLQDEGVDFISPYLQSLYWLFQLQYSLSIYKELVRTELAILEYRLDHGQDIRPSLLSLTVNLRLCRPKKDFYDFEDATVGNLEYYLLLIHERLMPLLFQSEAIDLRGPISLVFLEIATAFSLLDCGPEEVDELFLDSFVIAMMAQGLSKKTHKYIAQRCYITGHWLWDYDLTEEQRQKIASCCRKAKEVMDRA